MMLDCSHLQLMFFTQHLTDIWTQTQAVIRLMELDCSHLQLMFFTQHLTDIWTQTQTVIRLMELDCSHLQLTFFTQHWHLNTNTGSDTADGVRLFSSSADVLHTASHWHLNTNTGSDTADGVRLFSSLDLRSQILWLRRCSFRPHETLLVSPELNLLWRHKDNNAIKWTEAGHIIWSWMNSLRNLLNNIEVSNESEQVLRCYQYIIYSRVCIYVYVCILMFVIIVDELTKANSKQLRCLAINK